MSYRAIAGHALGGALPALSASRTGVSRVGDRVLAITTFSLRNAPAVRRYEIEVRFREPPKPIREAPALPKAIPRLFQFR
jgi:hypothetical protein